MSRVVLEGLEFHAHHGVFESERQLGARFIVDIELHWGFAGITDELSQAVNYAEVYAAVAEEVTQPRYQLIEVLTERIARRLLADHARLDAVTVRVHKPFAPLPGIFRDVYAELTLGQEV